MRIASLALAALTPVQLLVSGIAQRDGHADLVSYTQIGHCAENYGVQTYDPNVEQAYYQSVMGAASSSSSSSAAPSTTAQPSTSAVAPVVINVASQQTLITSASPSPTAAGALNGGASSRSALGSAVAGLLATVALAAALL